MINELLKDAESRMAKSILSLRDELKKLRTGRAHTSLLDHISIEYYGTPTPLSQVASVNAEDSRTLTISPYEKTLVADIEKAIMNSDLGLTPTTVGTLIRVPLPSLTEERRRDMTRVVRQEGEQSRIAIRNIRRDMLSDVKDLLKAKDVTEDDERKAQEDAQKITDKFTDEVDGLIKAKEAELMEV